MLDLGFVLTPDLQAGRLRYRHRWTDRWSAFAEGWAGRYRGVGGMSYGYGAMAGVEVRW